MANEKLMRKRGDTGPPVDDTLQTDGSADDLSGATVAFSMWDADGNTVIDDNESNVTVEDAANGDVEYNFQAADLDTSGQYYYEWTVTFADGEVRTYPNEIGGVPLSVS